jgi:hypothetical protein
MSGIEGLIFSQIILNYMHENNAPVIGMTIPGLQFSDDVASSLTIKGATDQVTR